MPETYYLPPTEYVPNNRVPVLVYRDRLPRPHAEASTTEFLEKNHKDEMNREESIKLTVKSLLEVVQTGAKNIEITVMESYGKVTVSIILSLE